MSPIEHALVAVMAGRSGDCVSAEDHLSRAIQQTRTTARRERQVVEIAALVVADDRIRAEGLALEHLVEFPNDSELLARLTRTEG